MSLLPCATKWVPDGACCTRQTQLLDGSTWGKGGCTECFGRQRLQKRAGFHLPSGPRCREAGEEVADGEHALDGAGNR